MGSKIKSLVADYKMLLRNVPALATTTFVLTTVVMNILAGKIILNVANVAITGGFLLSAIPFLCMDTVTRRFGARASIMLNILSAVANVCVVIIMGIVAAIPTEDDYSAFNYVAGGVWFIAVASTVAFVVSGIANSLINVAIGNLFANKGALEFYSRSFVSTFLGQAIDNFLFIFLTYTVFAPIFWGLAPLPVLTCLGTAVVGGAFELMAEAILAPVAFRIVKGWERDNVGHEYIEQHS